MLKRGAEPLLDTLINDSLGGEYYQWNARLKPIKQNALALMNPAPEKASAANASYITWSMASFLPVYFPQR